MVFWEDLKETDKAMSNVYSVTQVNTYIKNLFVRDGVLGRICIKGEISNCKYHTSGHIYFSLKDESAQISCVMFYKDRMNGLDFKLEDGQSVIVTGSVNVFERDGVYNIYARNIELSGLGALYIKYEELKRRLASEGYFDPAHKKPIPAYIKTLGVVTAKTGAALRDIISIAKRRNPYVQVVLVPAKVQGEGAAESVVKALKKLDEYGVDVIIVGRGGGSIEDLWAFNEEIVAMTVYDLKTPVISAVGHETDTTIIDYVSDLRAPTPSAAAELAVYQVADLKGALVDAHADLLRGMMAAIENARQRTEIFAKTLEYLGPENRIAQKKLELDSISNKLKNCLEKSVIQAKGDMSAIRSRMETLVANSLYEAKHNIRIYSEQLRRLSPLEKISKGYAYVSLENKAVKSIRDVNYGDKIEVNVLDGTLVCEVDEIVPESVFEVEDIQA